MKAKPKFYGNLPVVDSSHDLWIQPLPEDSRGAKAKNPTQCVLARCCKRAFGSQSALFFRHFAYVELADGKGGRVVKRFALSKEAREDIAAFDKTGKAPRDGLRLVPVRKHHRLDVRARYMAALKKRRKAAKRRGEAIEPAASRPQPRRKTMGFLDVRNGSGIVRLRPSPQVDI
jgi:hypothetical protein